MAVCQGFCVYPLGRRTIYAMLMAIATYLFVISSTWSCFYVDASVSFNHRLNDFQVEAKGAFGLFAFENIRIAGSNLDDDDDDLTCYTYTDSQRDLMGGAFKAARIFGLLANIFTGVPMILLIAASCCQFTMSGVKAIAMMEFAGSLFILLTFTMFGAEVCDVADCQFYYGAGFALGGMVCALVTGLLVNIIPPKEPESNYVGNSGGGVTASPYGVEEHQANAFDPGTQTTTEMIMPDGSKKVTTTTVNADGSRTVEETMVPA